MESKMSFIPQKVDKLVSNLVYKYVNNPKTTEKLIKI